MTVQSDLKKAVAYSEGLMGSYAVMAHATEDEQAKEMFNVMKSDLERHIQFLTSRMDYLNLNNKFSQENPWAR